MKKYRRLVNEIVRVGDVASTHGMPEESTVFANEVDSCIGLNSNEVGWDNNFWYREVPAHNWISFKDRKPTEADANSSGIILVLDPEAGGEAGPYFTRWNYEFYTSTHWMPLNFVEETRPVKVDGKALVPQKDGSVKISCGTTIPKEDVEEFLRQRNEVMK